jgi:hypothetical protein
MSLGRLVEECSWGAAFFDRGLFSPSSGLRLSAGPNIRRLVQVALTDITARKKAEAYLEYLGTHDVTC